MQISYLAKMLKKVLNNTRKVSEKKMQKECIFLGQVDFYDNDPIFAVPIECRAYIFTAPVVLGEQYTSAEYIMNNS